MILEESVLSDIIQATGLAEEPDFALGHRRSVRFPVEREITITPVGVANPVARQVMLSNISTTGLCVVDKVMMSAGAQFMAFLPMSRAGDISVLCTVRQGRISADGAFRIGAEFTSQTKKDVVFVRGVDGMLAAPAASASGAAGSAGVLAFPAVVLRGDGGRVEVAVRTMGAGAFLIESPVTMGVGERFEIDIKFPKRSGRWRCTVLQVSAAHLGTYAIHAKNDGAVVPPPPEHPMVAWLKRKFRG